MSSKLPLPTFHPRREWKSMSQSLDGNSSSNTSGALDEQPKKKDKYSHIGSKVKTHWSFEEKQRHGIKDFFERKSGTSSANTSVNTSSTKSPDSTKANTRRSLPMPLDPIAIALAQIKRNTRFYTFSESAQTSTSMSSINETQEH